MAAESFKKKSEINLFATDEHRSDTDLAEVEKGRAIASEGFRALISMAQAVQVNRPYLRFSTPVRSTDFFRDRAPPPDRVPFGARFPGNADPNEATEIPDGWLPPGLRRRDRRMPALAI